MIKFYYLEHTLDKNGYIWPAFLWHIFVKIPLGIQIVLEIISEGANDWYFAQIGTSSDMNFKRFECPK